MCLFLRFSVFNYSSCILLADKDLTLTELIRSRFNLIRSNSWYLVQAVHEYAT
jgi:hypothetical protein